MEIHVTHQAAVFLWTVAGGLAAGFIYELFRLSRRLFKTPDIVVFLCDTLYWLIVSVLSFGIILRTNSGEIRWFLFAGLGIGGVLYFSLFSGIVSKLLIFFLKIAVKTFLVIRKILAVPLKIIGKPLGFMKKSIAAKGRKIRKSGGKIRKKLKTELGILKKVRKTS